MKPGRALVVALAVLAAVVAAAVLYQRGPSGLGLFPGCLFHRFTGLQCPGCGMTRATYATLHGDFARAFRLNPVGMVLLPIALVGLVIEALGWVRDQPLPFRLKVGSRGGWVLAWIVMVFWVLIRIRPIPALAGTRWRR
jgi:hypothetical protein